MRGSLSLADSNWVTLTVGTVNHKVKKETLRKSPKSTALGSFLADSKKCSVNCIALQDHYWQFACQY